MVVNGEAEDAASVYRPPRAAATSSVAKACDDVIAVLLNAPQISGLAQHYRDTSSRDFSMASDVLRLLKA